MIFVLIGVYWQIKRIQVSDDAIKDPHKFDNMIRALRSRKAVPKYSSVLWEASKLGTTPEKLQGLTKVWVGGSRLKRVSKPNILAFFEANKGFTNLA